MSEGLSQIPHPYTLALTSYDDVRILLNGHDITNFKLASTIDRSLLILKPGDKFRSKVVNIHKLPASLKISYDKQIVLVTVRDKAIAVHGYARNSDAPVITKVPCA